MFGRGSQSRRQKRTVTVPSFSRNAHLSQSRLSPEARRWLKLGLGAVLAYLFVAGNMGAWRLVSLWRTEQTLERREARLLAEIIILDTRQQMLKNDTTYIEMIARTEYNLSRPDETIYLIDDSAP
jgi:cell division protein FtsB